VSLGRSDRALLLGVLVAAVLALYLGRDARGTSARLAADAWYYHATTVSLVNDRDLDFTDEYRAMGNWYHLGPTATGRLANPFGVGASLMTVPLYLVGTAIAALTGGDTGGFGAAQVKLSILASPLYTVGALAFALRLCRRRLGASWPAGVGPLAVFLASPVLYYAVRQPGYAHPQATFFVAWLVDAWDASFDTPAPRTRTTWLGLGALLGAAALARPQLAPWAILLPIAAVDDVRRGRRAPLLAWGLGALTAALVFAPQLVAWKVVYGSWVAVPQGPGFMVWGHPAWSEVLFAAKNGLFAWAPLLAFAGLGLVLAAREAPRLALGLVAGVALQVWVNGAVWDWWGGGAYGGRRFDSCAVAFAFGLAWLLARSPRALRGALAALVAVCVVGNLALAAASNVFTLEGDASAPPRVTLARKLPPGLGDALGGLSWLVTLPARAAFAWRHGAELDAYDRVVGTHWLSDFYPGVLGRPVRDEERVALSGREPVLVGFAPAAASGPARLTGDHGTILVSINRRHGPLDLKLELSSADVSLTWDGVPVAATASPGAVTASLEPVERGVHELGLRAPAGTELGALTLRVRPGTPP
jgi:hypothetical protein